ncbi:hypothetical protein UMM65_02655 [Aureibaculum sp. 2210JD6-5]|uniref:hypothetical protein n=1 Tax=Aureibaculum sp. 2210JD6-5 TaxID=3103957 RepID=UPI002AAE5EF6|nr:hypothetical protein [Aureibaculum sp. 2210JD6-5]MDY7394126.1 hypothetical protein [Aureibaculum sp. 2210JD6-5]
MRTEDYKRIIQNKSVLGFSILSETKKQLKKIGLAEIERILIENKIAKPKLHNIPDDIYTDFYFVDSEEQHIDLIISIFGDLEATNLGENYVTTPQSSFYGNILDKWNGL